MKHETRNMKSLKMCTVYIEPAAGRCAMRSVTRYTVRIYGQITLRTYGTNRKKLCPDP